VLALGGTLIGVGFLLILLDVGVVVGLPIAAIGGIMLISWAVQL
jgi:hypothetical protein